MLTRIFIVIFLLAGNLCPGQKGWQLEIMPGVAGYKGDLTESVIPVKSIGPGAAINLKYNTGDMIVFRLGLAWAKVSASDRNNKDADLKDRNLDFQTHIWEANLCAEVNILDPEAYVSYPYVFIGIGGYRFNPYAFDNTGKKTYLQPLSTEGQGLPEYPDRKPYSLTQFCIPLGGGWKVKLSEKTELAFEIGVRYLLTDYLDDVSTTYIDKQVLLSRKGPTAVELAYRKDPAPVDGAVRGNPDSDDIYAISGIKLTINLGTGKRKRK